MAFADTVRAATHKPTVGMGMLTRDGSEPTTNLVAGRRQSFTRTSNIPVVTVAPPEDANTSTIERYRPSPLLKAMLTNDAPEEARARTDTTPLTPTTPNSPSAFVAAAVKKKGIDSCLVDGVLQFQVQNKGFRLLDERFSDEGIESFGRRSSGAPLLLREKMMSDIIMQRRSLKDLPASDVSAVQGDLKHLSMRQLLKIRAVYLELKSHVAAVNGLIEMTENLLLEQVGKQALNPVLPHLDEKPTSIELKDVARRFILIVATSNEVADVFRTPWWVYSHKAQRLYLNVDECECSIAFPEAGVLDTEEQARMEGPRTQFRWLVNFVHKEADLCVRKAAANMRATSPAPNALGIGDLAQALGGLKKVRAVTADNSRAVE
jgi:hypothetical protein